MSGEDSGCRAPPEALSFNETTHGSQHHRGSSYEVKAKAEK